MIKELWLQLHHKLCLICVPWEKYLLSQWSAKTTCNICSHSVGWSAQHLEYIKVAQRSLILTSATQQHDNILFIKNESQNWEYVHELKENYSGTEGKKIQYWKLEQTTSPKFNFSTHTQVVFPSLCTMQWLWVVLPHTRIPWSSRIALYLVKLEKVTLEPLSYWIMSGS